MPDDNVPVPNVVEPSLKVIVPVAALGVTVAVKVTDWPTVDGLSEDVTEEAVVALPIVIETAALAAEL